MTTHPMFPTQEIGSLAKPRWQLLGQRGDALDGPAKSEFEEWNRKIHFAGTDPSTSALLEGRSREIGQGPVRDLGALFALRFFETAGLDRVYDGEARRVEMYEYP
ncbi:MAG: hypothetical protein L3J86_02050, partial [Thermoplasmata archaeon]|nr:hypothetical protein [Thermoplasmata archaeon]